MSFKLTYLDFKDPEFEYSLGKLANAVYKDEKASYNIAKIWRRFKNASKDAQETWAKLYIEYVVKDEKGEIVPLDGKPGTFTIRPDLREQWVKVLDEFNSTVVEFDCHRLDPLVIKEANLSPKDMVTLEEIILEKFS